MDQDETLQLCMQVDLGPSHTVLDWDPAPAMERGTAAPSLSKFTAHVYCGQMARLVSDIAIFVLKRDVKLQLTN